MRAKFGDKTVCQRCNGTGTALVKIGRYVYAMACKTGSQPKLQQRRLS